jgi:hypothetical protein
LRLLRHAGLLTLLVAACAGCKHESKTVLQKVDVDAEDLLKESALGWFPGELNARVADTLRTHGLPVLKEGEEAPSGARVLKGRLSLDFSVDEGKDSTPTEVAVEGVMQLAGKTLGGLSSVNAHRQEKLAGAGPEDKREAMVRAVEGVLDDVAAAAGALVKATGQSDGDLIKVIDTPADAGTDPIARRFAVKVLADRKNPAAVPALLEQLKDDDLDEVRAAIGALVEMKDTRAAAAMIDTAHSRDALFQREVVYALGAIGGEEAEAFLFTMAQGHDEPAIRAAAQQALDELKAREKKK